MAGEVFSIREANWEAMDVGDVGEDWVGRGEEEEGLDIELGKGEGTFEVIEMEIDCRKGKKEGGELSLEQEEEILYWG